MRVYEWAYFLPGLRIGLRLCYEAGLIKVTLRAEVLTKVRAELGAQFRADKLIESFVKPS